MPATTHVVSRGRYYSLHRRTGRSCACTASCNAHLTLTQQAWLPEEAAGEKNNRGSGLTREVGQRHTRSPIRAQQSCGCQPVVAQEEATGRRQVQGFGAVKGGRPQTNGRQNAPIRADHRRRAARPHRRYTRTTACTGMGSKRGNILISPRGGASPEAIAKPKAQPGDQNEGARRHTPRARAATMHTGATHTETVATPAFSRRPPKGAADKSKTTDNQEST